MPRLLSPQKTNPKRRALGVEVCCLSRRQRTLDDAAARANAVRQRQALIADLDRMVTPPAVPDPPEPTTVFVSGEDEASAWPRVHRWFDR
jgi:hypothetical protein